MIGRVLVFGLLGLGVAGALFIGMQSLVKEPDKLTTTRTPSVVIRMPDPEVADPVRKRERPPPKPPDRPPTPPSMTPQRFHRVSQATDLPSAPSVPLDLPGIQLATDLRMSPSRGGGSSTQGLGAAVQTQLTDGPATPIVRVEPLYPRSAEMRRISGWVIVEFTVDKTGQVSRARVLQSEPSGIFDRAALVAIEKWRYRPQVVGGVAKDTPGLKVKLRFRPKGNRR